MAINKAIVAENQSSFLGRVLNPESVAFLSRARPAADEEPMIIGDYDSTPNGGRAANPDKFVWCSQCQKYNHYLGFVVQQRSGSRHLIGRICGARHYGGVRFKAAKRSYSDQVTRNSLERRLERFRKEKDAIEEELRDILNSPWYQDISAKKREIELLSPDFATRMKNAATLGELYVHEPHPTGGLQKVLLGVPSGVELFVSSFDSRQRETLTLLARLDEAAEVNLEKTVKEISDSTSALIVSHRATTKCYTFFLISNLRKLARWSKPHHSRFLIQVTSDGSMGLRSAAGIIHRVEPLRPPPSNKLAAALRVLRAEGAAKSASSVI